MTSVWGIHNDALTTELIEGNFISIGWDEVGDISKIGPDRTALKAALAGAYPEAKRGSIPVQAGILRRFAFDIQVGDVVVAPYRPDRTINIGIATGPYQFLAGAPSHRHHRPVEWKRLGVPRPVFTQAALYEIGSAMTVFGIRNHPAEFLAVLRAEGDPEAAVNAAVQNTPPAEAEEAVDEPRVKRVNQYTRDFILEQLKAPNLTHQEFEEFTAVLLRSLGYQARVTPFSQDGGVDVVAHRDPLGVEPPLIKVQCKHHTGTISSPEVSQLEGTRAAGELAVFVTLGNYSKDAKSIERQKQGLRLLDGEAVVDLFLSGYAALPTEWRLRIPLTPLLVVNDGADD
ncbi:restriction endonuclease [Jatrophihabitans lederbergiae]|uniref:Restriction endonuclease n=1 Tax=Jatrophihabitans lederbergiae TaxID=3075547 RepID=A0ABU2JIF8_9ACTN|nr:restriction endonuclease [Jatrophihabitans sp. DSM 44399]MDT0264474.1 restriction endonuclease [Jatrophihabitans sp. DSM 44399]